MKNYALINTETNAVQTTIAWDGITEYTPPDGYMLIDASETFVTDGWSWDGQQFVAPTPPVVDEEAPNVLAE
jgi:hypothetical protein